MAFSAEAVNNPHEAIHIREVGGKTYGSPHGSYCCLGPKTFRKPFDSESSDRGFLRASLSDIGWKAKCSFGRTGIAEASATHGNARVTRCSFDHSVGYDVPATIENVERDCPASLIEIRRAV